MPEHPSQIAIWRTLDKVTIRKVWAAHLDVAESEISRWATGQRAMSHDDLKACLAVCVATGHRPAAERVVAALSADFGEVLGDVVEPPAEDPLRIVVDAARAGAGAADALESSLADDGKIAGIADAERIERAADVYRELADRLGAVATRARKLRVVPGAKAAGGGR